LQNSLASELILVVIFDSAQLREEVHQSSAQANDGENHQADDEQVFHNALTTFVGEKFRQDAVC
jgi:hypothetical protein